MYGKDEASELENLRIKQRDNPHLRKLINRLETGKKKQILHNRTEFRLKEGCLVGNASPNSSGKFKLVVPEEDALRVTFLRHKIRHFGINKLFQQINEKYIWNLDTGSTRGIRQTVEMVVKSCLECSVYQRPTKHIYKKMFETLHASQQYNCGAVVFMDHYSVGKTNSRYKEMIGALCGRCKRAMVEPVERGNSNHTAHFILRQICNPLIPSRLISDHGSAISLGTVPKLLEAINSGISNFYDIKEYRSGGQEQKYMDNLDNAHILQKWKEAHESEFENDQELQEKLHDMKQRIEEGRVRLDRAKRERMLQNQWRKIHKNKEVRRMEHMKSSVYHPTSHSSIERFFRTFSTLIRKLFEEENNKWTDYVDQVVALYNNTAHTALRGHSPNSAHFNLMHDQTQPMIHQILAESGSEHPFVVEEKELFTRALRIFNEAGIEKYFEPRDKKEEEERKHEKETEPAIGDLVWVRRLKRLDKHPKEGYLMGPCVITDKPTSQQVEVLYLLNGKTARRHYSHVTQFFRPIGTDTQRLLEYSSAPRLYQNYEGRRVGKEEREKLIQELETGLQGKTYLSAIDDLDEVDMMLKDRFSLLDYPEEYSEERTEKLRELYHSNTPEGKILRDSVTKDAEEEEEHEEFRIEDPDSWYAENEEEEEEGGEDDEEEEFGKTVTWDLPDKEDDPDHKEIGLNPFDKRNIIERRTREKPTRQSQIHLAQLGRRKDKDSPISSPTMSNHRMEGHPCQNVKEEEGSCHIRASGSRPYEGSDEISFLLAMAQRNSRKAEKFFKRKEEKSRPSKRSGKKVRSKK